MKSPINDRLSVGWSSTSPGSSPISPRRHLTDIGIPRDLWLQGWNEIWRSVNRSPQPRTRFLSFSLVIWSPKKKTPGKKCQTVLYTPGKKCQTCTFRIDMNRPFIKPFFGRTAGAPESEHPKKNDARKRVVSGGSFNPQPLPSTRNGFKTNSRSKYLQILGALDIQRYDTRNYWFNFGYPETSTHYPPCGAVQPCHRGKSFSKGINGGNDDWAWVKIVESIAMDGWKHWRSNGTCDTWHGYCGYCNLRTRSSRVF